MTLHRKISAPPHERRGAGAPLPSGASKTSRVSLPRKTLADKPPRIFNGHDFLREGLLVALTPEDLNALSHSRLPYCFPKLRAALAAELEPAVVI